MSKMEEMAFKSLLELNPHRFGYATNGIEINAITTDYETAYTQGWKDCLVFSEEVKELVEQAQAAVNYLSLVNDCQTQCDAAVDFHSPECTIEQRLYFALSKFREKVGE